VIKLVLKASRAWPLSDHDPPGLKPTTNVNGLGRRTRPVGFGMPLGGAAERQGFYHPEGSIAGEGWGGPPPRFPPFTFRLRRQLWKSGRTKQCVRIAPMSFRKESILDSAQKGLGERNDE